MGKFAPKHEQVVLLDLHDTADAAFSVDMDLRISDWNHAAELLFGIQAEEAVGRRCSDVMSMCHPGEGRTCSAPCAAVANARRGRVTPSFATRAESSAGNAKWFSFSTMVGHTTAGQPRVIHLVRDVSTHHMLEDRVVELARGRQTSSSEDAPVVRYIQSSHAHSQPSSVVPTPRPQLTQRELEVLQLVASGLSNAQIADMLSISPFTVRNHVTNVAEKLGVKTRLQAVVAASLQDLI